MADYIEREAAVKRLLEMAETAGKKRLYYEQECMETAAEVISGFPAADVAQVVRCKDCIFKGFPDEYDVCRCERTGEEIQLSGFCSHAVREEQNND